MQSAANRNKESMKIRVKLSPEIPLKVGERAEVVLYLQFQSSLSF
jgi:HlyD family secretion protein